MENVSLTPTTETGFLEVTGSWLYASHIRAAALFMEQGIRGARKVVLPGTAHMPSVGRPEEFDRIVLEFLRSVTPGPT